MADCYCWGGPDPCIWGFMTPVESVFTNVCGRSDADCGDFDPCVCGGGGRVGSSSSHSQGVPAPVCGGSWSQDTDLYGHHFPGSMGLEVLSCSLGR